MNIEQLITEIIRPLIVHTDDLVVKTYEYDDETTIQVMVNHEDMGRVIGKNGKVANSIRTIVYAAAAKRGTRVKVNFDYFE